MSKRVAMLVSNPCDPDYRVVKQAETLARAGYEVRVFCTWKAGLGIPIQEVVNGVTYVRREWSPAKIFRRLVLRERLYPQIPVVDREAHKRISERRGR